MTPANAERDRWLALGLLLAVLALVYLVLVHPWWTAPMLEVNKGIADSREPRVAGAHATAAGAAGGETAGRRHRATGPASRVPARSQCRTGHRRSGATP